MQNVKTIGSLELSRRLDVAQTSVWRWSRQNRLGSPVNPDALKLRFLDDEQLAFAIEIFKKRPRSPLVWGYCIKSPVETLEKYAFGELETDT